MTLLNVPPAPHYQGKELELFAHATRWKAYWSARVLPFLRGDVLEVGAGIGTNTLILRPGTSGRYLCVEPDPELLQRLKVQVKDLAPVETLLGTVNALAPEERFDTAIYVDVLEHVEDDVQELARVASHIKPGGHIIVLTPAYEWLYSTFDKEIGHCRRYSAYTLQRCAPPGAKSLRLEFLDTLGVGLSLSNRLLRQTYPSRAQLAIWDRAVVPFSRVIDRICGFRFGRSILAVWSIEA